MWRVLKESRRPWPVLSDDPVTDYKIMEAVAAKVAEEDQELREKAEKEAKVKRWKEDKSDLMKHAG
jgi:hypothetical protein